jgi:hypothetical protein
MVLAGPIILQSVCRLAGDRNTSNHGTRQVEPVWLTADANCKTKNVSVILRHWNTFIDELGGCEG